MRSAERLAGAGSKHLPASTHLVAYANRSDRAAVRSRAARLYGGTGRVVAHLCDALVELGHDVTLFASAEAHSRRT